MEKTRIILCGACGKMGGNVLSLLQADEQATAVCGVDLYPREIGIPVYKSFDEIKEEADIIIDFSSPIALHLIQNTVHIPQQAADPLHR